MSILYKDIEELRFDPENPRLPNTIRNKSDSDIISYMVANENLFDLISSIKKQGFFDGEPLLVIPDGSGKFIVVEGNRRFAAVRLLNNPELSKKLQNRLQQILQEGDHEKEPPIPKSVPVLVYKDKEKLWDYLGYRHVTGVDAWDSLAKARYLTLLFQRHYADYPSTNDTYRHIASLIGSNRPYVQKLIEGYQLYEHVEEHNFYGIRELDETSFKFSLITTAVSYTNISEFLEIRVDESNIYFNPAKLEELTRYLFEITESGNSRIPDSRDLGKFSKVVKIPLAYEVFSEKKRTLEEAIIFTNAPVEAMRKFVHKTYSNLKAAQDTLSKVLDVSESSDIIERLEEIHRLSDDIIVTIETRKRKARQIDRIRDEI
ncbi:ParB/Srx family N-terminal domain-containing protein [Neolewinella persica]|uniref:ParB/Srx family N-terminal domain-containing protein n=1 Tax=Neolewinella persica TaxID=70998 RepID=UPI00035CA180|nr:ParB/Srx family N-terminal domain-containing protein [Neolewinella persica]